jgi:SAM-dependent methyltransferase
MMNQNKIFLKSEGDAWYKRNSRIISNNLLKKDILLIQLENIIKKIKNKKINILEVGCSNGRILNYLKLRFPKVHVFGLEPSKLAIKNKLSNKIIIKHGVANKMPFQNKKFDFLIFGFCLYLCDSTDLINIVQEANRVTKSVSYIAIDDFFSKKIKYYNYHHKKGILTRKMDYSKIFLWHPFYSLFFKKIFTYEGITKKNKNLTNTRSVFILKKREL